MQTLNFTQKMKSICVDLKVKSLFRCKSFSNYCTNAITATKYPNLSATIEPFLPAFPGSYTDEAGLVSQTVLTKQRNILNTEEHDDL